MTLVLDRRARKRLTTRQNISNAATALFMDRGFDDVTIDDIASAADVGRVTVFNHFPRKEDLIFDRDDEGRERFRDALQQHEDGISPVECLRRLAHRWVADREPYVEFTARSRRFFDTIDASETLKARARAIRDELSDLVAAAFAERIGGNERNEHARLAANVQVSIWSAAFIEGHMTFRQTKDTKAAEGVFLDLIDRGSQGLTAAFADTGLA